MNNPHNRRQYWRAHFSADATLQTGTAAQPCLIDDISLRGALLEMPAGISVAVGKKYDLLLELSSGTAITMQGTIVHVEAQHVGFHCDSIDLDSLTHLRRLIELNAGDAKVYDRDLSTLLRDRQAAR
jgi:hypothetical protein